MIFYNANDNKSKLIQSVLDIKKIEYRTETVASVCGIGDRELLLLDLFPALKYLEERHPVPKLFSDNPEQNARLNLFVLDVMLKAYDNGDTDEVLTDIQQVPFPYEFLLGDNISIADLVLYPILPDNDLQLLAYKTKIKEQLDNIQ